MLGHATKEQADRPATVALWLDSVWGGRGGRDYLAAGLAVYSWRKNAPAIWPGGNNLNQLIATN